jgi:transcriptional regulator with XRE-family HTH domain
MDSADLAMVATARQMCASGGLSALCEQCAVKGTWLAQAVARESGLSVSPSTVSRWMRGEMLPHGARALGLFTVVSALVTATGGA